MATSQAFTFADCSTLANFQAWAQLISNAFSSFGWTKSSDTGQVNLSTISAIPGNNSYVYEIWTMNDSLAASNPVYVKMEYGCGGNNTVPALAVTVGSGSNGAGVLTNAGTRTQFGPNAAGGTTQTYECDLSGGTGRISFLMWRGWSSACFFSIERSHDANGNDTSAYVTYLVSGRNAPSPFCFQQTILPAANGGPLFYELYGLTVQTSNTTAAFANSVAVAPFWPFVGKLDNPLMGAVCIKQNDFADGAQFGVSVYGATHNYLVSKTTVGVWGNQSTNGIAMRYE